MTANEILRIARAQLGVKEAPAGTNRVKYNTWFYGREVSGKAYPWCMVFVQWCFAQAGAAELLPERTASCGALRRAAQAAGLWVTGDLQPGDVVIYSFSGKGTTDHCGIVEKVSGGTVTAIEGNTSERGSQSNGGMVCRKNRPLAKVLGALRPEYEAEEEENMVTYKYLKDIPAAFRPTIEKLMDAGIIQGDGSDPDGSGDVIGLTHEQVRTLVFVYRGGGFDRRLTEAGLESAV